MARRIVSTANITPAGTADTSDLVDATYPFMLNGGTATQLNKVWEISISGLAASSSSVTPMLWSRDSQSATGANTLGAGQTDTFLDPATAALAAIVLVGNSNATLKPRRDTARHLANAGLNAFGGVYFWRANRLEECFTFLGNTAALFGEGSLSCFTGGTPGLIGAHMIYESL
jgi:hypothetical protein